MHFVIAIFSRCRDYFSSFVSEFKEVKNQINRASRYPRLVLWYGTGDEGLRLATALLSRLQFPRNFPLDLSALLLSQLVEFFSPLKFIFYLLFSRPPRRFSSSKPKPFDNFNTTRFTFKQTCFSLIIKTPIPLHVVHRSMMQRCRILFILHYTPKTVPFNCLL